jgi:hypothetical protein
MLVRNRVTAARERSRTVLIAALECLSFVLQRFEMVKRRTGDDVPPAVERRAADWHGRDEAGAWLHALGLDALPRWHVEVSLDAGAATKFSLNVYAEEWGFAFHHARRSSWIRVTDIPFVHGRDDFGLIAHVPALMSLASFLTGLEAEHGFKLARTNAAVRSNIDGAVPVVRRWLSRTSVRSHRRTGVEQCGDELHDGICCTLKRGHEGPHVSESDEGALRWKQQR